MKMNTFDNEWLDETIIKARNFGYFWGFTIGIITAGVASLKRAKLG